MDLVCLCFSLSILWIGEAANHANHSKEVLKIGGITQDFIFDTRALTAFEIWKDWSNSAAANLDYTIELNWINMDLLADQDTYARAVQNMTDPSKCGSNCVDVLILPSYHGRTKAISAMPASSPIPLIMWASHSKSDFTTHCIDLNCFGFARLVDGYVLPCFDAILSKSSSFTVAAIVEKNKTDNIEITYTDLYDRGARTWIEDHATVTMVADVTVNMTQTGLSTEDIEHLDTLMVARPDVVFVLGDFPYYVLLKLQTSTEYRPKAIICAECYRPEVIEKVMVEGKPEAIVGALQPISYRTDLWDNTDSIIGWTFNSFKDAMQERGQALSWDGAAAVAAGTAITHAMAAGNAGNRKADLTTNLKSLDIDTFFGPLQFNADGSPGSSGQLLQILATEQIPIPPNDNLIYPMPGGHPSWENEVTTTTILPATTTARNDSSSETSASETSASSRVDCILPAYICVLLFIVSAT